MVPKRSNGELGPNHVLYVQCQPPTVPQPCLGSASLNSWCNSYLPTLSANMSVYNLFYLPSSVSTPSPKAYRFINNNSNCYVNNNISCLLGSYCVPGTVLSFLVLSSGLPCEVRLLVSLFDRQETEAERY